MYERMPGATPRGHYGPSVWLKAIGLVALVILALVGLDSLDGGTTSSPPGPPQWLVELDGQIMEIGRWQGHNDCWGSVNNRNSNINGAVGCLDGYRETW